MKINFVLVDFENVPATSLALLKGEQFRVRIFLGPHNTKLPVSLALAMQELGDRASYVTLETSGSNALDFHIAYYLGALATAEPAAFFHIISKDTGFDPLIQHLNAKRVCVARSASIDEMPCFSTAAFNTPEASAVAPARVGGSGQKQNCATPNSSQDDLLRKAITDLVRRHTSRPRTLKTLLSTLHATCGKELSPGSIKAVYESLVQQGYVKLQGTKVSYSLPEQPDNTLMPLQRAATASGDASSSRN